MALWEAPELKGRQSWPSEDHQDLGSTWDHRTRPMKPKGSDHPEREQQTQQVRKAEPSTSPHSFSGAAGDWTPLDEGVSLAWWPACNLSAHEGRVQKKGTLT